MRSGFGRWLKRRPPRFNEEPAGKEAYIAIELQNLASGGFQAQAPPAGGSVTEEVTMIARIWRGWANSEAAANSYAEFLKTTFLPSIHAIAGYRGAWVMRRNVGAEIQFTTITRFETIDSIRAFAGEDYEAAHVAPRARELLSRFDARCEHFELVIDDVPSRHSSLE
jgi:hypothetical protein